MNEITLSNSTRILKFTQLLKMDFNEYSIWNYSRKKFKFKESDRPMIKEALDFLLAQDCIQKVRRSGYFKLTDKGSNFISWDLEKIVDTETKTEKPVQKGWLSWLSPSTKVSTSA